MIKIRRSITVYAASIQAEEDVLAKNEIVRLRYRKMLERITDFD